MFAVVYQLLCGFCFEVFPLILGAWDVDQLPRLGKIELICLLLFTNNYVVSVWRGFLLFWVLGMGYVISLWHSLSLPYNYFEIDESFQNYNNLTSKLSLACSIFLAIKMPNIVSKLNLFVMLMRTVTRKLKKYHVNTDDIRQNEEKRETI